VGLPCRAIAILGLVAPRHPPFTRATREQLEIRPGATCLDNFVLLVRLARVLALARRQKIHLPSPGNQGAGILPAHAKQDQLGDVAEVEAYAATIGAAVLTHFVPDEIGFVSKAPRLHHREAFGQERIRAPEVKVRRVCCELLDRQGHDVIEPQGAVARQPPVLRGDFAGLVNELPRRIGKDGRKPPFADKGDQIASNGIHGCTYCRDSRRSVTSTDKSRCTPASVKNPSARARESSNTAALSGPPMTAAVSRLRRRRRRSGAPVRSGVWPCTTKRPQSTSPQ